MASRKSWWSETEPSGDEKCAPIRRTSRGSNSKTAGSLHGVIRMCLSVVGGDT